MSFTAPSNRATRLSFVAGACLALCGAAVQAATPTQAELDSIVLYGSTTIAQDSTSVWGVWEQIDPPAAGPAQPSANASSSSEWYRSLAQVSLQTNTLPTVVEPTATLLCAGGSLCGFGQARVSTAGGEANNYFADHLVATPEATELNLFERLAALEGPAETTLFSANAVSVQSQSLSADNTVLLSNSGRLRYTAYGYAAKSSTESGFQSFSLSSLELSKDDKDFYSSADGQAGWFDNPVSVTKYVVGNEAQAFPSRQVQDGKVVMGVTTNDAHMAELRASKATATYTGHDYYALGSGRTNMRLNVNFGEGTFTGSLNNGIDGKVASETGLRGAQLAGAVGVNIDKGVITGANFMSTALSAKDGSIKAGSVVQGAFFGPNAAAAGGVVNITKTTANYSNATFVSPFLAVNDKLIKAPAPINPR